MALFELAPCTNCKADTWTLGARKKDRTEFHCFACGAVVTVLLTNEQFRHLAGGE